MLTRIAEIVAYEEWGHGPATYYSLNDYGHYSVEKSIEGKYTGGLTDYHAGPYFFERVATDTSSRYIINEKKLQSFKLDASDSLINSAGGGDSAALAALAIYLLTSNARVKIGTDKEILEIKLAAKCAALLFRNKRDTRFNRMLAEYIENYIATNLYGSKLLQEIVYGNLSPAFETTNSVAQFSTPNIWSDVLTNIPHNKRFALEGSVYKTQVISLIDKLLLENNFNDIKTCLLADPTLTEIRSSSFDASVISNQLNGWQFNKELYLQLLFHAVNGNADAQYQLAKYYAGIASHQCSSANIYQTIAFNLAIAAARSQFKPAQLMVLDFIADKSMPADVIDDKLKAEYKNLLQHQDIDIVSKAKEIYENPSVSNNQPPSLLDFRRELRELESLLYADRSFVGGWHFLTSDQLLASLELIFYKYEHYLANSYNQHFVFTPKMYQISTSITLVKNTIEKYYQNQKYYLEQQTPKTNLYNEHPSVPTTILKRFPNFKDVFKNLNSAVIHHSYEGTVAKEFSSIVNHREAEITILRCYQQLQLLIPRAETALGTRLGYSSCVTIQNKIVQTMNAINSLLLNDYKSLSFSDWQKLFSDLTILKNQLEEWDYQYNFEFVEEKGFNEFQNLFESSQPCYITLDKVITISQVGDKALYSLTFKDFMRTKNVRETECLMNALKPLHKDLKIDLDELIRILSHQDAMAIKKLLNAKNGNSVRKDLKKLAVKWEDFCSTTLKNTFLKILSELSEKSKLVFLSEPLLESSFVQYYLDARNRQNKLETIRSFKAELSQYAKTPNNSQQNYLFTENEKRDFPIKKLTYERTLQLCELGLNAYQQLSAEIKQAKAQYTIWQNEINTICLTCEALKQKIAAYKKDFPIFAADMEQEVRTILANKFDAENKYQNKNITEIVDLNKKLQVLLSDMDNKHVMHVAASSTAQDEQFEAIKKVIIEYNSLYASLQYTSPHIDSIKKEIQSALVVLISQFSLQINELANDKIEITSIKPIEVKSLQNAVKQFTRDVGLLLDKIRVSHADLNLHADANITQGSELETWDKYLSELITVHQSLSQEKEYQKTSSSIVAFAQTFSGAVKTLIADSKEFKTVNQKALIDEMNQSWLFEKINQKTLATKKQLEKEIDSLRSEVELLKDKITKIDSKSLPQDTVKQYTTQTEVSELKKIRDEAQNVKAQFSLALEKCTEEQKEIKVIEKAEIHLKDEIGIEINAQITTVKQLQNKG